MTTGTIGTNRRGVSFWTRLLPQPALSNPPNSLKWRSRRTIRRQLDSPIPDERYWKYNDGVNAVIFWLLGEFPDDSPFDIRNWNHYGADYLRGVLDATAWVTGLTNDKPWQHYPTS